MLLTIKQPANHGYKSAHDYTPPTPPSTSRFSPAVASTGPSYPSVSSIASNPLPFSATTVHQTMSTPHRGLPVPNAMTLPQPPQQPVAIGQAPSSQPMGPLPAPQQWQGDDEAMRYWFHAKTEEEKRRQEEEKTRQESLRLEQRKIEQDMLRTSLTGGIPPYMIPMVFAGMGGGNLPNASLEWAQHYMSHQVQQQQQQLPQGPPLLPSQSQASAEELQRRGSRAYAPQQHPASMTLPSTPVGPPNPQQSITFLPSNQMSPESRSRQPPQAPIGIYRPPQTSNLPRLDTGETQVQLTPPGPGMQVLPGQPGHPLQQSQSVQQQEPQESPAEIYFHYWHPPKSQADTGSSNNPETPSDHTSSPKKRKATGPQQAAPPPTSQPQYTPPPFSQTGSSVPNTPSGRRQGHSRQRSDLSARELSARGLDAYNRPISRHRPLESAFSPIQTQGPEQGPPLTSSGEPRQRSGGFNPVSSMPEQSRPQLQPHSQQQPQRDSQYSAGSEMRHKERRTTPEEENPRHSNAIK